MTAYTVFLLFTNCRLRLAVIRARWVAVRVRSPGQRVMSVIPPTTRHSSPISTGCLRNYCKNIYCHCVHLYWEGCVICNIYLLENMKRSIIIPYLSFPFTFLCLLVSFLISQLLYNIYDRHVNKILDELWLLGL